MSEIPMEAAVDRIVFLFQKYSKRVNGTVGLTLDGFTKMMREQLPNFFKDQGLTEATFQSDVDKLFNELDMNKDSEISFNEFTNLVKRVLLKRYHM